MQATKGGGFDTPRSYRSNLVNNASTLSYVPDYIVADMDAGNWMNYTRTLPNSNYVVYLRASSEARQDVRLDEVTNPPPVNTTAQGTVLRGQFLVPNTESWTRWRYVPLTDAAGNVQTLNLAGLRTGQVPAPELEHGGYFLAVVLDLDNGPSAPSRPENSALYSRCRPLCR